METPTAASAGLDEGLRALSHDDRRTILYALADADGETPVPVDETSHLELDATPTELHHQHLPLLADQEFVSWNTDPLVVARGPRFHKVAPLLERLEPVLDGTATESV